MSVFMSPFMVGADGLIMNRSIVRARKKSAILLQETSSIKKNIYIWWIGVSDIQLTMG